MTHHTEDVANWHLSAEPKSVDMVWGSVAFPASEAFSGSSSSAGPWLQANRAVLEAATTTTPPWRQKTAGQAPSFIARGPVQIEYAVWKDMVSHPFTLQSGGKRIDQQLCYLGALLQGWEEAAALHVENVKPWTNDELCVAPTKSNWENGLRDKTLQRQYHNQRRHAKRTRFDWWRHNGFEDWLFRDA